jgi:hypothetical protein
MSKRSSWNPPTSGEVWIGKRKLPVVAESLFGEDPVASVKWRRIIAVRGGFVFYNCGGDDNGECRIETFRRWARENEAAPRNA